MLHKILFKHPLRSWEKVRQLKEQFQIKALPLFTAGLFYIAFKDKNLLVKHSTND